jgi:hypothetical protein
MTEIAARDARMQTADGTLYEATYALHDDGTVTRQITAINGVPQDNRPTPFRWLNETERRVNLADGISALGFLLGVISADGWTDA